MLVLSRKVGQGVVVGPYLVVLRGIGPDGATLEVAYDDGVGVPGWGPLVRLKHYQSTRAPSGDVVYYLGRNKVERPNGGAHRLGFDGPSRVVRTELVKGADPCQ